MRHHKACQCRGCYYGIPQSEPAMTRQTFITPSECWVAEYMEFTGQFWRVHYYKVPRYPTPGDRVTRGQMSLTSWQKYASMKRI